MKSTREYRPEVAAITTATQQIELADGQGFYITRGAWEIWENDPVRLVKRIPHKRVFFVFEKEA
jgi:hypothetical protein